MRRELGKQMMKQRSMQSQMSKLRGSDIPSDMGVLPDTLLKPESKDLPSLFSSQYRKRLRIEWKSFLQPLMDTVRYATNSPTHSPLHETSH